MKMDEKLAIATMMTHFYCMDVVAEMMGHANVTTSDDGRILIASKQGEEDKFDLLAKKKARIEDVLRMLNSDG
jgi:hypothetical protein